MKNKTELVNKLLASMNENSEQWELSVFRFTNKEWGIDLWIANGRSAIRIQTPTVIHFNWWQRRKLWRAYKESSAKNILQLNCI